MYLFAPVILQAENDTVAHGAVSCSVLERISSVANTGSHQVVVLPDQTSVNLLTSHRVGEASHLKTMHLMSCCKSCMVACI